MSIGSHSRGNAPKNATKLSKQKAEDPRSTTLNYEYKEQPAVKANLTQSELDFLEDDKSQMGGDATTSSGTSSQRRKTRMDPNNNRFVASLLVLITFGSVVVYLNAVTVSYSAAGIVAKLLFASMTAVLAGMLHEWDRIHGTVTLSRKWRPVLNISSVFATYKRSDPDAVLLQSADNYRFACCNVPELNSDLPRTSDESSPPTSPSKSGISGSTINSPGPKSDREKSESLTSMQPTQGKPINLEFENTSPKEF